MIYPTYANEQQEMRQYNSDNKEQFSQYAEQLICTAITEGERLDYHIVKGGIDYLMEQGDYVNAEKCLYYNINNPDYTSQNRFALICRGLFLCSLIDSLKDKISVYQTILNDLSISDPDIVDKGKETPLYMIHKYVLYIKEASETYDFRVETTLRQKLKDKFENLAYIIPSIPYYKAMFSMFQYRFPKLMLDILHYAVKDEANDEDIYTDAAQILTLIGTRESLAKAEKILNNVLDRNAYNDKAWFELGEVCHELGDYKGEMDAYKRAEIINKNESSYTLRIAETYYDKGNYANALEYFIKYDNFPVEERKFEVYDFIGNCYMNIGQFEEAIEYYDKSFQSTGIMTGHDISQGFFMKLICLIKLGRAKEAEEEYNKVDSEYKIKTSLWSSLKAQILLALGKQEEAESYLMEMADNNEYDAYTLIELIEFQLKHETYILARFYINMLLCFTKELNNALMYEAVVDYKCGDKDNAANNLNTAFKIDPLAKENFYSYCPEAKKDIYFQDMLTELPF